MTMMRKGVLLISAVSVLCAPPVAVLANSGAEDAHGLTVALGLLRANQPTLAAAIFDRMAQAGDADAQFNMALLFDTGVGVPQNDREAIYWAWRARLAGVAQARVLLEKLAPVTTPTLRKEVSDRLLADLTPRIQAGEGRAMLEKSAVLQDLLEKPDVEGAYVWQTLAAALGTPNATAARDATLRLIAPDKRAAAQDRAMAELKSLCAGGSLAGSPLCAALF